MKVLVLRLEGLGLGSGARDIESLRVSPLKLIEYGNLIILYPKPYSIYSRGL